MGGQFSALSFQLTLNVMSNIALLQMTIVIGQ